MNIFEVVTTIQGFILFIEFFLYVNQNNPVRHLFAAMYVYLFYLYMREKFAIDTLDLSMHNQCLVSCMEPKNNTHGELM